MKLRSWISSYLPSIAIFIVILVVWQLTVPALKIPTYLLPTPSEIISAMLNKSIPWWPSIFVTTYESLLGFAIAVVFGIGLAILMSVSERMRLVAYPYVITAQVVPKLAFIPILFIWIGFNITPKIVTVFLVCFFPIVIDSLSGLLSIQPDMVDLVRTYSPSRLHLLRKAMLPTAMPSIFTGLKVSITLAVIGALVAEFISSNQGLGYLIITSQEQLNTTLSFAAATVLVILGLILYIILEVIERVLVPWQEHGSVSARSL